MLIIFNLDESSIASYYYNADEIDVWSFGIIIFSFLPRIDVTFGLQQLGAYFDWSVEVIFVLSEQISLHFLDVLFVLQQFVDRFLSFEFVVDDAQQFLSFTSNGLSPVSWVWLTQLILIFQDWVDEGANIEIVGVEIVASVHQVLIVDGGAFTDDIELVHEFEYLLQGPALFDHFELLLGFGRPFDTLFELLLTPYNAVKALLQHVEQRYSKFIGLICYFIFNRIRLNNHWILNLLNDELHNFLT